MAENGVNGHQNLGMQWKVGLMNSQNCYMTAESFGSLNASGITLKKKQVFTIQQDPTSNLVYIQSYLGRYLKADRLGKVKAESESDFEETGLGEDHQFKVEYNADGLWAFKHIKSKTYLAGNKNDVSSTITKEPAADNWWSIHLYVHPQINLRNSGRKLFAHLSDNCELECTEVIPWGEDALVTLDFTSKGKYTMKASNNRYLNREGGLDDKAEPDSDNMFTMEIHQGCLAFKDSAGRYLTAAGRGSMKAKNKTINTSTKDELFTIEESHPQVNIISHNGKCVSIRQGVDVSANQKPDLDDMPDTDIFQLEYTKSMDAWAIRTSKHTYWCLQSTTASVQATGKTLNKDCYFKFEWLENGKMAIKGPDGNYLSNKKTGVLFSASASLDDNNKFTCNIVNRPILVLKSDYGFVGAAKGDKYVCNQARYDAIKVKPTLKGSYIFTDANDRYLGIDDDKNLSIADGASEFFMEFHEQSMLAILTTDGKYMKGEQNGLFRAMGSDIGSNTLFEY